MRIAVVGATGNAGTAVLRELAARDEVEAILGIARRLPNREMEPYRQADWAQIDIQFDEARNELVEVLSGYDAVIHLAWLIQPNKKTRSVATHQRHRNPACFGSSRRSWCPAHCGGLIGWGLFASQ